MQFKILLDLKRSMWKRVIKNKNVRFHVAANYVGYVTSTFDN